MIGSQGDREDLKRRERTPGPDGRIGETIYRPPKGEDRSSLVFSEGRGGAKSGEF